MDDDFPSFVGLLQDLEALECVTINCEILGGSTRSSEDLGQKLLDRLQQLRQVHKLSLTIIDRETRDKLYHESCVKLDGTWHFTCVNQSRFRDLFSHLEAAKQASAKPRSRLPRGQRRRKLRTGRRYLVGIKPKVRIVRYGKRSVTKRPLRGIMKRQHSKLDRPFSGLLHGLRKLALS